MLTHDAFSNNNHQDIISSVRETSASVGKHDAAQQYCSSTQQ